MSWLARSLANSLRLDDQNDVVSGPIDHPSTTKTLSFSPSGDPSPSSPTQPELENKDEEDDEAQTRGVKEDLSEFGDILTRQLWGVASFLAPPPSDLPQSGPSGLDRPLEPSDRPDPAPEMAWDDREEEEEEEDVEELDERESLVGITDEVLAFARNIAMHPETWLDFPLDEEEDLDDFDMSEAQQEHTMTIERLAPRLMALRIELCPCHMSEGYFWKVYFVLLHSRLNKTDAEALFTPQVMEARAKWMQELHNQTVSDNEWHRTGTSGYRDSSDFSHDDHVPSIDHYEDATHGIYNSQPANLSAAYSDTEKYQVDNFELRSVDKSVIEENSVIKIEDEEDDDWPDEDFESIGYTRTSVPVLNEDDISFSDLEDDDFHPHTPRLKAISTEFETSTEDR